MAFDCCCPHWFDKRCYYPLITSINVAFPIHSNSVTRVPMENWALVMLNIDRNDYLYLNRKYKIFFLEKNSTSNNHKNGENILESIIGGAFKVEPKFRFRRLSKRFVKFVDAYGDDRSLLSCSPFVLDSLDADAWSTLLLWVLLSAASVEYRLFDSGEASCESWPLKTVDVVLKFVSKKNKDC